MNYSENERIITNLSSYKEDNHYYMNQHSVLGYGVKLSEVETTRFCPLCEHWQCKKRGIAVGGKLFFKKLNVYIPKYKLSCLCNVDNKIHSIESDNNDELGLTCKHFKSILPLSYNGLPEATFDITLEDEENEITVDVDDLKGFNIESDEKVLIAHGTAKFMKNEGKEIGQFAGKIHFVAQEQTQQSLICIVTNKRIVFYPEANKKTNQMVFSTISRIMGVDWITRMIANRELFKEWLDRPLEIERDNVLSAEMSLCPVGNIVIIHLRQGDIYVGTDKLKWSMDIHVGIMQPRIFME